MCQQTGDQPQPSASNVTGAGVGLDDMFGRMLQGIGSQLFMQQSSNGSIADFLSGLGEEYNITQGEGIFKSIHLLKINIIVQKLF